MNKPTEFIYYENMGDCYVSDDCNLPLKDYHYVWAVREVMLQSLNHDQNFASGTIEERLAEYQKIRTDLKPFDSQFTFQKRYSSEDLRRMQELVWFCQSLEARYQLRVVPSSNRDEPE